MADRVADGIVHAVRVGVCGCVSDRVMKWCDTTIMISGGDALGAWCPQQSSGTTCTVLIMQRSQCARTFAIAHQACNELGATVQPARRSATLLAVS
jgi:hypothetical protein